MNEGGFSWKRLVGISQVKSNISSKTGIPVTRSGRNQKIGRIVTKGCLGSTVLLLSAALTVIFALLPITEFFFELIKKNL
jgi:flagellar biosynthesis component FlhA